MTKTRKVKDINPAGEKPDSVGDDEDGTRAAQTTEFREWLRGVVERTGKSLHSVEVEAGIRGNALGKFLRGERGRRHSLTPLMIRRLAPVLLTSEEEMMTRAGHLSHAPWNPSVMGIILRDPRLDDDAKRLMLDMYSRLTGSSATRATGNPR